MSYGYAIGCGLISFLFAYFLLGKISAAYFPAWIDQSTLWGALNLITAIAGGFAIFWVVPKR